MISKEHLNRVGAASIQEYYDMAMHAFGQGFVLETEDRLQRMSIPELAGFMEHAFNNHPMLKMIISELKTR